MTRLYIHAVNPHYSATWADFAFSDGSVWMVCSTKNFPLEPASNFGCLYACDWLSVAVDIAERLKKLGGCDSFVVVHPPGAYQKKADGGEVFDEYTEYKQHPERFLDPKYNPQKFKNRKKAKTKKVKTKKAKKS